MKQIEKTNYSPNKAWFNTINVEGLEYIYTIKKNERENVIIIQLIEKKPYKNIIFLYKASQEKIVKNIKYMIKYKNIEEIIISLQNIFNKGKISVKKKDEKYLVSIEITEFSKTFKYEIELEKNELKDENMKILNKIKEIEDKYKE